MRFRFGTVLAGSLLALAAAGGARGAEQDTPPGAAPRKQARAVRVQGRAPHLDGRLDEAAWKGAPFVADFLQKEPEQGAPPGEATEVGFLYDDGALYVGARMHSQHPELVRRIIGRRDNAGNTERLIVTLDTYCDRRTSYSFSISCTGVRSDYYHPSDNEFDRDFSYNPVWEGSAAFDSLGWTAEMRIPFSQLRFDRNPQQVWGLDLNRWVPQRNEDDFWIYVPRDATGWASRFGDLVGIEGIQPSRRLELLPYAAGNGTLDRNVAADDPFRDEVDLEARAGGDLKMGLGPNLTLDGTVNPDFGQVEADPAEVNLTQFETFFDERRPFFVEGSQVLRGSGPSYYYSRRIGAPPLGGASGDFVRWPATTTILGAAKVTGRLASGLSLGGLAACTDREYADTYDATAGVRDRVKVTPRTGYGVVRLQQEFGASGSTAGLCLTSVSRDLHSGDPLAAQLDRHAYSGGGDWLLRFRNGQYELGGSAGFSWLEGTPEVLRRIQTAPAHYFQRPDAGHVGVDTTRTSLGGWTTNLYLERRGGAHWLWGGGVGLESSGFELNDLGSLQSADDIDPWAELRYRETNPGRVFRDYSIELSSSHGFNFGGVRKRSELELDLESTWRNFMHSWVSGYRNFESLDDDQTRGGPLFRSAAGWGLDAGMRSNFATTTYWTFSTGYSHNELEAWNGYFEGQVGGRLGRRWELTVTPGYERGSTARQYVTTRPGGPEATYGTRYIFARIDRSTVRVQMRVNCSLTPDLTLEAYAEPFAAAGCFGDFGELRAARSNELRLYGTEGTTLVRHPNDDLTITDGPDTLYVPRGEYPGDFLGLSYRSNVVLRWEWRRGSTLYAIWQRNRGEFDPSDRHVRAGDLWDAFTAQGQDLFAIKASYWLPLD